MPTPVDIFYMANRAIGEHLIRSGEISLKATFDAVFSKGLLIAATSFFEGRIQEDIKTLVREFSSSPLVDGLIQSKAIHRQYHTYFNWDDASNANQFFRIFGIEFRDFMREEIQQDAELNAAIRAFLDLGKERNSIVHFGFAETSLQKTADEVYEAYQMGMKFVDALPVKYREFTSRPATA